MKKIKTSSITSTKGLIFEKKQIDFLQENVRYVTENIAYTALNAKNLNAVILWGCVPTFSTVGFVNDTLTITEGSIQHNGTIYRVDAQAVTRSVIGNVHYLEIAPVDTSEGNPSTYTDLTTENTQENTKIKLAQGLTGGGIVDWVNVGIIKTRMPSGGNTDYVLTKNSPTDYDASFNELAPYNSVALSTDALTYLTAGVMYYAKAGKIVTVTLNFSLIDVGFAFLVNATAFPPPITPFTFLLLDDITSGRNDYKMDASGFISKLFLGSGTVNGSCTFSYICA